MSEAYEKDITERTSDRNLILLGCRADADIDYRDKKLKTKDATIKELRDALNEAADDMGKRGCGLYSDNHVEKVRAIANKD